MKNWSGLRWSVVAALVFFGSSAFAELVAPKPAATKSPTYPSALEGSGRNGIANVEVLVKKDGSVADPVLQSADDPAFGEAAMAVIGEWTFEPATRDGAPIDLRVVVPFQFRASFEDQFNAAIKRKVFLALPEPALTEMEFGRKLKVKKKAQPVFPRMLARSGIRREDVKMLVTVAPDGTVVNPRFEVTPTRALMLPAIMAVARMTYQPPLKDGKGVYVETSTVLRFEPGARRPGGGGRGGRAGRPGRGGGGGMGGGGDGGFGGDGGGFGGGGGGFGGGLD